MYSTVEIIDTQLFFETLVCRPAVYEMSYWRFKASILLSKIE